MTISVELSQEQMEGIRKQVIANVTAQLTREVTDQLNAKQIVGEIKNGVIKAIAEKMSSELKVRHNVDENLHRAIQSAESRVTTYIQKMLTNGITVRFGDMQS